MEEQFEGKVRIEDVKPKIEEGGIWFPVSSEVVDLSKFGGDARSFGYEFDDGICTVIKFERAAGVLADDTLALFLECQEVRKAKKADSDVLDFLDCEISINESSSTLVMRSDDDFLYKDETGFWYKEIYLGHENQICRGPLRVSEASARNFVRDVELYRNAAKKHNEKMAEFRENMKILARIFN